MLRLNDFARFRRNDMFRLYPGLPTASTSTAPEHLINKVRQHNAVRAATKARPTLVDLGRRLVALLSRPVLVLLALCSRTSLNRGDVSDTVVVDVLAAVAYVARAQFAPAVVREALAAVRRMPPPRRLPGPWRSTTFDASSIASGAPTRSVPPATSTTFTPPATPSGTPDHVPVIRVGDAGRVGSQMPSTASSRPDRMAFANT
jgi:hypothetical protein